MERHLLETTESYRVSDEGAAKELIENAKKGKGYILKKYTSQYKEKKQKGEIVETWYKVILVKQFNDEKEPGYQVEILYNEESAF